MPTYVYLCESNGAEVEVFHPMADTLTTWGELCEQAELDPGSTPADAPVHRKLFAPAVRSVRGAAELKNLGFTKLVKRDDGVYENVTRSSGDARYLDANDPGSAPASWKCLD